MTLEAASVLLIVLAAADWWWTAMIIRAARTMPEPSLIERAVASAILSTVATMAAVVGANILGLLDIPRGGTTVILVAAFVLVSAPQFVWGTLLLMGRFK
jgi:hypothetical protein